MSITDGLLSLAEHKDLNFKLLLLEIKGRDLILRGFKLLGLYLQVRLRLLTPLLHVGLELVQMFSRVFGLGCVALLPAQLLFFLG